MTRKRSGKFRIGDKVRVQAVGPIREFDGVIVKEIGPTRFDVRDEDGNDWYRLEREMRLIGEAK